MTAAHSTWNASGFERKMLCAGSYVLEVGQADTASEYAAEGTAAHQVLTWALDAGLDAADYIGTVISLNAAGRVIKDDATAAYTFTVDEDMARHVQVAIDYAREVCGADGTLLVDRKVNYAEFLGVPQDQAWGTSDFIIMKGEEIVVVDLKYGQGVAVDAGYDDEGTVGGEFEYTPKPNPQIALYGLGALSEFADFGDFKRIRLVIIQPRVSVKPSEYDMTVEALRMWGFDKAMHAVTRCIEASTKPDLGPYLVPGEKQCKFCKASAICPALRAEVASTVFHAVPATADEFAPLERVIVTEEDDAAWLGACFAKVDLVEAWIKAVEAEVNRRLHAGQEVPGYKLVLGREGNRAWTDEEAAEALLKRLRLKAEQMYASKIISPTAAEKLAKDEVIGPRQWLQVQALIKRNPAQPKVAPVSDPRPALVVTPVADDFTDVTTPEDLA